MAPLPALHLSPLVIDEVADLHDLLVTLSPTADYTATTVPTLEAAATLTCVRPDVIVIDTGCRTIDELAVMTPRLFRLAASGSVVLLSSLAVNPAVIRVAGYADVIQQPFDIDDLTARVKAVLTGIKAADYSGTAGHCASR